MILISICTTVQLCIFNEKNNYWANSVFVPLCQNFRKPLWKTINYHQQLCFRFCFNVKLIERTTTAKLIIRIYNDSMDGLALLSRETIFLQTSPESYLSTFQMSLPIVPQNLNHQHKFLTWLKVWTQKWPNL